MYPPLKPGRTYHVFNRGNNRENLFREKRNYSYFLDLYRDYIEPVASTFAYCLMPNHFHSLVRIKSADGTSLDPKQQYSNFFNAYAKAINKGYGRTGALFERPFRRIEVESEFHCTQLVLYIHLNPQKHGFTRDFRSYPFSSYHSLISGESTFVAKEEVAKLFGGMDRLIEAHVTNAEELALGDFIGDEETCQEKDT